MLINPKKSLHFFSPLMGNPWNPLRFRCPRFALTWRQTNTAGDRPWPQPKPIRRSRASRARVYGALAEAGQLPGVEATERFYEIGSPQGLADLEANLASPT